MPKPLDVERIVREDKPFPLSWKERFQMGGALVYIVFLGIPVLIIVIIGLFKAYASLLAGLF